MMMLVPLVVVVGVRINVAITSCTFIINRGLGTTVQARQGSFMHFIRRKDRIVNSCMLPTFLYHLPTS